jgi:ribosomal protein L24E
MDRFALLAELCGCLGRARGATERVADDAMSRCHRCGDAISGGARAARADGAVRRFCSEHCWRRWLADITGTPRG